jgi:hypothetical protein
MQGHWQDWVNASFEFLVTFSVLFSMKALCKDKEVKGYSPRVVIFFNVFGVWNLFYYSKLQQLFSTAGVAVATTVSIFYSSMFFYYIHREKIGLPKTENRKNLAIIMISSVIIFWLLAWCLIKSGLTIDKANTPFYIFGIRTVWPDFINALFEWSAGLIILDNCFLLLKEKKVKGFSFMSILFVTSWGGWNIYYYAHLGQWLSWCCGFSVFAANLWYSYLVMYYKFWYKKPIQQV